MLQAQPLSEGSPVGYFQRPLGARAVGLAGAYSAVANEPLGLFANPATAAWLPPVPSFGLSLSVLGLGRIHGGFAYAQALGTTGFGLGTGIQHFSAGSFTARNSRGEALGSYTPQNVALLLAGSYRWEFFSIGLAGKYLWSGLSGAGISGAGGAADLGALFHIADRFTLGVALSNLGGFLKWEGHREAIPLTVSLGVATELWFSPSARRERDPVTGEERLLWLPPSRYVLLSAECRYSTGTVRPSLVLGLEAAPLAGIALRGGMTAFGDDLGHARWLLPQRAAGGISAQLPETIALPFRLQLDYAVAYEYSSPSRLLQSLGLTAQLLP